MPESIRHHYHNRKNPPVRSREQGIPVCKSPLNEFCAGLPGFADVSLNVRVMEDAILD
jgi:hypothetical protein